VIVGELLERYRAGVQRREPVLPEPAVSLDGYLAQRRAWLGTAEAATAIRDARTALLGARPLPLRPGPASRTFRGKRLRRELPAAVVAGLRDVCGRLGVTSYQCLAAAVSALLARYTGQSDVVVTTNVVNRTEAAQYLVGNFTTAILPRFAWTGDPPYPQLLDQVRAVTVAAQEHQRVPAVSVLGRLGWDDYRQLTPAGQVSVQVLRRSSPLGLTWPVPVGDIEVDLVRVHLGQVPGDLGVEVIENDAGTALSLDYNLDVFAEPEALRLRDALDTVLARVVAEPDRPLSTLLSGLECRGSG
jgi:non-ribosomal peptide synthetase component F